ncbi:aminotransferase class I/II-fold pyridoxal phosphate-dependent enzyme [Myxococcus sp. K15C18031901]|uniref:aminotransferase class I/II-fold pyridoxal phosphate-dependent enzyme n=1 Tax=Myxococcus dinghuensis TaxID=2906761 RepID=UPI0020A7E015|nr:aminotransferase class I/II-fold pyridoxal phosphate-dependent enzyme [Myxococcus dinghuensis]MCP3102424.1 aminotransferase class I/II-fold pyridoxal phosphate-dependent enzyme [Myxococcus dinghuensis]
MPLAVSLYGAVPSLEDGPGLLNLAWTLDERRWLSTDLDALVTRELEAEAREGLSYVNRYFVKDPYGDAVLGPAVAAYFGREGWSAQVTCGAGVVSLLHALALLTEARPVLIAGDCYPDLPFWLSQRTAPRAAADEGAIDPTGASLVFLERPSLLGDRFADLGAISTLCAHAARHGAVVAIDESNANYYPPGFSAANLLPDVDNLVVIRGFSKAYQLGGLRLAYCLAAPELTARLRTVVPPLLASSLSLRVGREVLRSGDVATSLRGRIVEHKAETRRLLEAAGIADVRPASQYLPYLFLRHDATDSQGFLERQRIRGKLHPYWAVATRDVAHAYRLSAPLSAERMDLLRERLEEARRA